MQQIEFIFLRLLLYMFRALHSPIIRSLNCTSGYGVTVCPYVRTADLDLAHTSPSHTNDLYSDTIPACTVKAPDDG
jgi:hypothetical protein